jgi:hypothetical protein
MNGIRKSVAAAAIAGSMLIGGVVGAVMYGATTIAAVASTAAATAATAATAASPSPGTAPSGTFVPNETAAHEATESAAREAQENAGQIPTFP